MAHLRTEIARTLVKLDF